MTVCFDLLPDEQERQARAIRVICVATWLSSLPRRSTCLAPDVCAGRQAMMSVTVTCWPNSVQLKRE